DKIDALEAANELQNLARREAADFRRAGARREARVETVDIKGKIGRAVADDRLRLLDDGGHAETGDFFRMDDRHAGLVGELPEIFRRAANADLDRAGRVQHAVEHGVAEGAAMVELGLVEGPARVAVRVDMDHADRLL